MGLVMEYVAGGNMADHILKTILLKFTNASVFAVARVCTLAGHTCMWHIRMKLFTVVCFSERRARR